MQLERAFIDPQGLPGRPLARYTITKNSIQLYVKEHFRLYTKFLSIFWWVFFPYLDTFFLRRAVLTPTPEAVSLD